MVPMDKEKIKERYFKHLLNGENPRIRMSLDDGVANYGLTPDIGKLEIVKAPRK